MVGLRKDDHGDPLRSPYDQDRRDLKATDVRYTVTVSAGVTAKQFSDSPDISNKPLVLTVCNTSFAISISE